MVINCETIIFILYIFRDDTLRGSELTSKLEPAFLSGLRCSQPSLRQKFVEVFDRSIRHRLYDRLLYIVCSQNWESMGTHFWIKQCIEVGITIKQCIEVVITMNQCMEVVIIVVHKQVTDLVLGLITNLLNYAIN